MQDLAGIPVAIISPLEKPSDELPYQILLKPCYQFFEVLATLISL